MMWCEPLSIAFVDYVQPLLALLWWLGASQTNNKSPALNGTFVNKFIHIHLCILCILCVHMDINVWLDVFLSRDSDDLLSFEWNILMRVGVSHLETRTERNDEDKFWRDL